MNNDVLARNELFSYEEGKPYASYKKTILGQVAVTVWDRFIQQPGTAILKGDPKRNEESAIVDVWNAKEDAFFRRMNAGHFKRGVVIPYVRPQNEVTEVPVEQFSDQQLEEMLTLKYVSLNKKVNEIESVPVLFRLKAIAEDKDKLKIVNLLEARIAEIQLAEVRPQVEAAEEE